MTMTTSTVDHSERNGQAMIETAIGLTVFVFVTAALVSFATLFLDGYDMLDSSRAEAGSNAVRSFGGESGGGNAFAISALTHPNIKDYGVPSSSSKYSDPWAYPTERFPDNLSFANWRQDSIRPLDVVRGGITRNFEINLSLLGSNPFFPKGITLKEEVYFPPMGGMP